MDRKLVTGVLGGLMIVGSTALAQEFSGSFRMPAQSGEMIVNLERDGEGAGVRGTMAGNGTSFEIRGVLEKDLLLGEVRAPNGRVHLRGWFEGGQLCLELAEMDAQGNRVAGTEKVLRLERAAGAPAAGSARRNPLGRRAEASAGDPLAGAYAGEGIALVLARAAAGWSGNLQLDGQSYAVEVKGEADRLEGILRDQDAEFPFSARLEGSVLTLRAEDREFVLRKEGAPAAGAAAAQEARGLAGGKLYRHALGLTFRYPEDWSVQEAGGMVQLIPPGAAMGANGPSEAYVVTGAPAPGVTRADDPQVAAYLDNSFAQIAPFLRRQGGAQPIAAGGRPGAAFTWEGRGPTGVDGRARVYVTLLNGYAIAVSALGEHARIEARDEVVRGIFASLEFGAAQTDPSLVGRWHRVSYSRAEIGINDRMNTSSTRTVVLQPDGTYVGGSQSAFVGTGMTGEASGAGESGRWAANNGRITLVTAGGAVAEYSYYLQGAPGRRELLLTPAQGAKELWTEYAD